MGINSSINYLGQVPNDFSNKEMYHQYGIHFDKIVDENNTIVKASFPSKWSYLKIGNYSVIYFDNLNNPAFISYYGEYCSFSIFEIVEEDYDYHYIKISSKIEKHNSFFNNNIHKFTIISKKLDNFYSKKRKQKKDLFVVGDHEKINLLFNDIEVKR